MRGGALGDALPSILLFFFENPPSKEMPPMGRTPTRQHLKSPYAPPMY